MNLLDHNSAGTNNFGLPTNLSTPALDTTGATLLVVVIGSDQLVNAPTDAFGNTWTEILFSNLGVVAKAFYCIPPAGKTGAGHTFTTTNQTFPGIIALAFSGTAVSNVLEGNNSFNPGTSVISVQTGALVPTAIGDLLITLADASASSTPASPSIDSGFTITDATGILLTNGAGCNVIVAYKVSTTGLSENPTLSWTNSSFMIAGIAAFAQGAAAAISEPPYQSDGEFQWGGGDR